MATAKKAPIKKSVTASAVARSPKKSATPSKSPSSTAAKVVPTAKAPAKKAPVAKAPVAKAPAKKAPVAKAPAKKPPLKKEVPAVPTPMAASKARAAQPPAAMMAPIKKVAATSKHGPGGFTLPPVKGVTKDGVSYTKDFDAKFLTAQKALLLSEREALAGQATRLEDEANSLIEEQEMGDVQFDDEGGEGDTMVVERERDLALSAQARQTIADIDIALLRLEQGSYGYSTESGLPIARERLEAIPWATVLVSEKVGGIGRR
jgi:RNA polymerase-binding transcription factor DksA